MARQRTSPPEGRSPADGQRRLIGRLSEKTLAQMEAETMAFMAEYIPRVEREGSRDWRRDVELFRELLLHHFNQAVREVLGVCKSVEEFEEALLNGIPRFVKATLDRYPSSRNRCKRK
jgi:hypothetical protein